MIICVLKTSSYSRFMSSEGWQKRYTRLHQYQQDRIRESHTQQMDFVIRLKTILGRLLNGNVRYVEDTDMDDIDVDADDIILSCGGDGMFLSCAQTFDNVMVGLNSDTHQDVKRGSIGALTAINGTNLEDRIQRIVQKEYTIVEWKRLYAKVNDDPQPQTAINEIYFGSSISYDTCDFRLSFAHKTEDYNSSGLIVCTGMGSGAWFRNAGGSPFSNALNAFGFVVREPNLKRHPEFVKGIVESRHEILVRPSRDGYVLSFDSKPHSCVLRIEDEIKIGLCTDNPVRVLKF